VEPGLKKAAERAAKKDRRSLTTYIEKLIENNLRETGQTIGKPARKRK
jgi:predicted HicB family RNase H-like nuclease